MKKLLLFCFLITLATSASAQYFQWARQQANTLTGPVLASGNNFIAVSGQFKQSITLGSQTFTNPDSLNAYLAVYDLAGNVLWAKHIISRSYSQHQVTVDASGNIIVSGVFRDSLQIGSTLIFKGTAAGSEGVFVARFSTSGTLLWARSSAISTSLYATRQPVNTSVTTDANGNIFVAGTFSGNLTFGPDNISSPGLSRAYLVKYDPNGTYQWLRNLGFNQFDFQGNAKAEATATGEVYFACTNYSNITSEQGFRIIKFNSAGVQQWSRLAATPTANSEFDLAADNAGNAYISGDHAQVMNLVNPSGSPVSNYYLPAAPTSRIFMAKINPAGTWVWARSLTSTNNFYPQTGNISLQYNSVNELAISGNYVGSITFMPNLANSTVSSSLSWNSFIAALDTAGTIRWSSSPDNRITFGHHNSNINSGLTSDTSGNYYLAGQFSLGQLHFNGQTVTNSDTLGSYMAKISNDANQVNGKVFLDLNSNGVQDTGDRPFPDAVLQSAGSGHFSISEPNGNYRFYLPKGSFSISLANQPRHYNLVPASHNVIFTGLNQGQNGKDFAIQPIPNHNDVSVKVTSFTPARPGFALRYRLTYHNPGTTTLSDTLKFVLQPGNLLFTAASVTPVSNSNGKMAWFYQNLLPNETRHIDLTFSVPANTVLGTPVNAVASIKPLAADLFPGDNADTVNLFVTGSFDPNDKQVNKPLISPPPLPPVPLPDYTIRFQNTGNDTAFTVVVNDQLSHKLQVSDLEMVSASHSYSLKINNANILEWRFDNILLPDSSRNEPGSHGYVRFRIKSKPGLVLGDSITNNAAIYFDYNAPVLTNYAVTKVANPLGIKESQTGSQAFKLYPNPANTYVTIQAELEKQTGATVSLVNMVGQTLKKVSLPADTKVNYRLPVNDLPKGVYLVRLETEVGIQTKRLVIQ